MKKIAKYKLFIIILSLGYLSSCDAPRTDRRVAAGTANDFSIFGNPNPTYTGTPGATPTPGDTGGLNVPSDASHCSWSGDGSNGFPYSNAHLAADESNSSEGGYSVCQSSTTETDVYLQLKTPITGHQLCVIPTYHSGSNSVYVGEPRCLYVRSSTSIYKVSLIKNRVGYTSYPITGVMIMRDKAYEYGSPFYQVILSPDAYIFCSQWLAQYGDPSYCIPFKSAGHYVYHQF